MLKKSERTLVAAGRKLVILVAGVALAGPAVAGNIYSWRTQSGDVAFTDDIKSVPSRYRDQVETRRTEPLGDYARFSSQDSEGADSYEERLQARLIHLQQLNDALTQQETDIPSAADSASLRIGGTADPVLNLAGNVADAPVIVERIRVIRAGQIATRHDTVVRQGNRTLAIIRGTQAGEIGGLSDVVSEEGLELYR